MTIFPLSINTRKRHSPMLKKAMGFPRSGSFAYSCSKVSLQLKPPVGPCVRGRMGGSVSCQTPVSPSSSHEQNPKYGICVKEMETQAMSRNQAVQGRSISLSSLFFPLPKALFPKMIIGLRCDSKTLCTTVRAKHWERLIIPL